MDTPSLLPRRVEQRRSRRFATGLAVDLHTRSGIARLAASDVGRHGILLRTDDPAPERHIVRLTLHLPSGPIDVTAIVSRTLGPDNPRGPGMGMQFFAIAGDAKDKWDAFIGALEGQPARVSPSPHGDLPVFFVKLKDNARLRAFFNDEVSRGVMTLSTPVLREVGTALAIVVVHPVTSEEFVLYGVVEDVARERPKRMIIRFHGVGPGELGAFQRFIATGQGYIIPPPASDVPTPPPPPPSDEPSFEIDITEAMVEEDARFSFDVATGMTAVEGAVPVVVGEVLESAAEAAGVHWTELTRPSALVHVRCNGCGNPDTTLRIGGAEGALGLFAELRPMWCPACRTLVGAPVATSALERLAMLARLTDAQRQSAIPLEVAFDVAALHDTPTCPTCRMELKQNKRARQVDRKSNQLLLGAKGPLEASNCPSCEDGTWMVALVVPEDPS